MNVLKIFNSKFDSCFAAYSQHKNYWLFKEKGGLVRLSNFSDRKKPRQVKKPILRETPASPWQQNLIV